MNFRALDLMLKIIPLILLSLFCTNTRAADGMWFPQLLQQLNEAEMRQLGMQISAEDIYSVNKSSLKDAVLQFGGGCTGELISARGLLLTNHHCGFSQIAGLSTIEKNYLEDGYWAMSDSTELPCPGLTVSFVKDIIDVTAIVLNGVTDDLSEENRNVIIRSHSDSLQKASADGKNKKAIVRSFYGGNEYFMFIMEVFRDIRLVGAPPVSVGKFGGETDNWMWPRHTGDFAIFRIYADSSNHPADYSKNNIPYRSKTFFEINIEGVKENDFTFVYGFPGRTNKYLTASSLDLIYTQTNPNKIKIREERLRIWRDDMNANDTIKLKYASKFKTIANYYKKWAGENVGLKEFKVVDRKKEYESKIISLAGSSAQNIIDSISLLNQKIKPFSFDSDYFTDGLQGIEISGLSQKFKKLIDLSKSDTSSVPVLKEAIHQLKADFRGFYKNYSASTDRKICESMLKLTGKNISKTYKPVFLTALKTDEDIKAYTAKLYEHSLLTDTTKLFGFLDSYKKRKLKTILNDEVYKFSEQINSGSQSVNLIMSGITSDINKFQRKYIDLIRSTDKVTKFFPDANSTLRVAYGKVSGMAPADGKYYNYCTTTDGILEKIDRTNPDFKFPERLEKIIRDKDFGSYAKGNSVPVAFMASNSTTNGNSGSPVLNSKGQLIGINFDRVWEGNMSDYFFDENTCRNIAMDMHYFLFVVDKFGNAKRLIDEMVILR